MPNEKNKPGPKADHLKIDGNWKQALKKVLGKKRPPEGWPQPEDERDHSNQKSDNRKD
jgi:hypothetical protein